RLRIVQPHCLRRCRLDWRMRWAAGADEQPGLVGVSADEAHRCVGHQRAAVTFAPDFLTCVRVTCHCVEMMPCPRPYLPNLDALPSWALRHELAGLMLASREAALANAPRGVAV